MVTGTVDEVVKVELWQLERLQDDCGLGLYEARCALDEGVDWHLLHDLLEAGCPRDLALSIAR